MAGTVGAAAATGSLKRSVSVAVPVPPGPVADRPTVDVPAAAGTPVIWPVIPLMIRPAGRFVAA